MKTNMADAEDEENESSVFEITDFTTASEWERFVSQIEEIIHKWKLDNSNKKPSFLQRVRNFSSSSKEGTSGNLKPIPKNISCESKEQCWETLSETLHFSDFCFDMTYHYMTAKDESRDKTSGFEDGLPAAVLDMFDMDYDFPPRVHCLSRWYGLKEFIVLSPSVDAASITSESRCHLLLSSVSMALANSKCYIPLLVQLHHKWRRLYHGLCLGNRFRTLFEMAHLRHTPKQFNHLKGLLDIFKDKLALRGTSCPSVTITVRFTYVLNEWSDTVWPQAPPDVDSCLGDEVGLSDMATLPFGTGQDAISELHLSVTWPCLSEDVIVDNGIYSDLDPFQAPQWSVRVRTNDEPKCLLGEYIDCYLNLCHRKEATSTLLKHDAFFDDTEERTKDFAHAFQKLTKSSNIQSAVTKATSRITGSSSDESPIPAELLDAILKHLFPDAETDPSDIDVKQEEILKSNVYAIKDIPNDRFRGLKGAPKDSLTYALAVSLCIVNHSYGGLRAVENLWREFVLEMRYRWERGILISRLELEAPNLDCCLIHQKLQMLNCCIARKCISKRRSQTSLNQEICDKHLQENNPERPASARSRNSAPGDDSSEDEFFEALEDQDDSDDCDSEGGNEGSLETPRGDTRREGALKRCGDLKLLVSGEPLYIPVTQEPAPMTEDMLQAHADILTQLGTTEEGARIRAQMQSASLHSDMEAFKAANPGCLLEDFVRWYSPNDWLQGEETEDEIEYRRKLELENEQRQKDEEQQHQGEWGLDDDEEITEDELNKTFNEKDEQNEESPDEPCSKEWCDEGRLSLRMRVRGNVWEDNWHNAKPCPVRRQKRLFDETKEAEKVLHYFSGLRPAEVVSELISTVLQASIRRIENAGGSDVVRSNPIVDRIIKRASRIFDTSQEQLTLYKDLFQELRSIELKIAQAQSLKFKLGTSEMNSTKPDIDTETFITSLLEKPEVNIVGASRGPIGHVIKNLFSTQEVLRAQEEDYDNHEILKEPVGQHSRPFPAPAGREFILRTIASNPGQNSRQSPQRMYCVLAGEEFRLAAAFTSDTTFT